MSQHCTWRCASVGRDWATDHTLVTVHCIQPRSCPPPAAPGGQPAGGRQQGPVLHRGDNVEVSPLASVSGWRRGRRVLACDVAAAAGPGRRQPRWPLCPTRGRGQFPVHNSGTGPCKYIKLSSLVFRFYHLKFYYPTKRYVYLNKNFSGAHLNTAISSGSDLAGVWAGPVARSCVTYASQ